jgi:hypothetical protein
MHILVEFCVETLALMQKLTSACPHKYSISLRSDAPKICF